ncbi:MAG: cell division protein FtsA [Firmicutes bacterium]|nr:cell division protein FtsA [Bacillota bacterium]
MSNIYAGIELGTNSIKIVVAEKLGDSFNILTSVSSKSEGIRNGEVVDIKKCVSSVRKALRKANDMLGIKITKVIACIPPKDCTMDIAVGSIKLDSDEIITGEDVSLVLKDALVGRIGEEYELVTAVPINFTIDDSESVKDPKGMKGEILETKVVYSTVLKEPLYRILEVLKLSGLDTIDIAFTSTGDYFTIKNNDYDKEVGAIINIGEFSTNISVFNKGIQIKNSTIPIGSINVDKDISYIFKISSDESRNLKENFAVSMQSYADSNDVYEVKYNDNDTKEISQVGLSKVVEARVTEILKLAKKEIKNLTNREIRYIIITGGLSELAGFQYLVEEELGINAKVCNISTMGIRHNKFSSVFGTIKYYDDKLCLRNIDSTMISNSDMKEIVANNDRTIGSDNIINKVFGHFFDN